MMNGEENIENDKGRNEVLFIQHQALFFELEPQNDVISVDKLRALFIHLDISNKLSSDDWSFVQTKLQESLTLLELSSLVSEIQNIICGDDPLNGTAHKPCNVDLNWLNIQPIEKEQSQAYELIFEWLQPDHHGYITFKQAIRFLFCAKLSDETLARIWVHSNIGCNVKINMEEFLIALHLTIYAKKNNEKLRGVIDVWSLLPNKFRKESLFEKQFRFVKLKLKKKRILQKLKDENVDNAMKDKISTLAKQIEIDGNSLKEEIKKGGILYKRRDLEKLFDVNFLKSSQLNVLFWIKKMRNKESSSRRYREPEAIFDSENIIRFSKALVIKQKPTTEKPTQNKRAAKSEFQRRLTSDLIELTEEIEKLRRDTSSNFEELNKEFEQVKASVDNSNFLDDRDKKQELSISPKLKVKFPVDEDVFEQVVVKKVENPVSFDFDFEDHKTLTNRNVSRKRLEETNKHKPVENIQESNSENIRKTNSLKRKDSKRDSLKRKLKLQQLENTDQNLAKDFTEIFDKLSHKPNDVIKKDVKSLIRQVSIETLNNPKLYSNEPIKIKSSSHQLKHSKSVPNLFGISFEPSEDLSDESFGEKFELKHFDVKYPIKSPKSTATDNKFFNQQNSSSKLSVDENSTNLSNLKPSKAKSYSELFLFTNKDNSDKQKQISEVTDNPELDLKKVFSESKNFFEKSLTSNSWRKQKTFDSQSIKRENFKSTKSLTFDSSEIPSKNNKSFVDNSVKDLLRNLSFNSRTKLLFFDELDGTEDKEAVRNLLNQISKKPRGKSADVRSILKDLSFTSSDMEVQMRQNNSGFDSRNRNSLTFDRFAKTRPDFQNSLFYTGENNNETNGLLFKRDTNDTFYNEQNSENKRRSFSKDLSNGEVNHVNGEEREEGEQPKKTKRVIRTKSGRVVKGLISSENPETVTFTEETEFLDKLCKEETKKNRENIGDLKNDKRNTEAFVSFGYPILPSPAHEKIERPIDNNYEDERKLHRSKSEDVIEDEISVAKGKTWLQSLIQQNHPKHEENSQNRKANVETNTKIYPVNIEWNASTCGQEMKQEKHFTDSINEDIILPQVETNVAESPYSTIPVKKEESEIVINGTETDSRDHNKINELISDDVEIDTQYNIAETIPEASFESRTKSDTPLINGHATFNSNDAVNGVSLESNPINFNVENNEASDSEIPVKNTHGEFIIDNENRGDAYMLPSEMRQQKQKSKSTKERRNTEDVSVLKRLRRFVGSTKEKNSERRSKSSDEKNPKLKSSSMKNIKKADIEMIPDSGKYISNGSGDEIAMTKYKTFDPDQLSEMENNSENDDRVTLPSVKDKLKMFQKGNSGSTNEAVMRKKKGSLFRGRPKSHGGFVKQASESELQVSSKKLSRSKEDLSEIGASLVACDSSNIATNIASDNNIEVSSIKDDVDGRITSNGINTSISRNSVKLCVKDQRILKEIADNEQRENTLRQKQYVNNNTNGVNMNGFVYADASVKYEISDTSEERITLKQQAAGVNNDPDIRPEGLQKFLSENVVTGAS